MGFNGNNVAIVPQSSRLLDIPPGMYLFKSKLIYTMITIDETLDEIFSKTDEEFLKEMGKQYLETLREMRKGVNGGSVTTEEAGDRKSVV